MISVCKWLKSTSVFTWYHFTFASVTSILNVRVSVCSNLVCLQTLSVLSPHFETVFLELSHLLPPLMLGLLCPLRGVGCRSLMTSRSAGLSHFSESWPQRRSPEMRVWLKRAPRTRPLLSAGYRLQHASDRCVKHTITRYIQQQAPFVHELNSNTFLIIKL